MRSDCLIAYSAAINFDAMSVKPIDDSNKNNYRDKKHIKLAGPGIEKGKIQWNHHNIFFFLSFWQKASIIRNSNK